MASQTFRLSEQRSVGRSIEVWLTYDDTLAVPGRGGVLDIDECIIELIEIRAKTRAAEKLEAKVWRFDELSGELVEWLDLVLADDGGIGAEVKPGRDGLIAVKHFGAVTPGPADDAADVKPVPPDDVPPRETVIGR